MKMHPDSVFHYVSTEGQIALERAFAIKHLARDAGGMPRAFNFNTVVPTPAHVEASADGEEFVAWRRMNWGSPTNAFDFEGFSSQAFGSEFAFRTRESTPRHIWDRLAAEFPQIHFTILGLHEVSGRAFKLRLAHRLCEVADCDADAIRSKLDAARRGLLRRVAAA